MPHERQEAPDADALRDDLTVLQSGGHVQVDAGSPVRELAAVRQAIDEERAKRGELLLDLARRMVANCQRDLELSELVEGIDTSAVIRGSLILAAALCAFAGGVWLALS